MPVEIKDQSQERRRDEHDPCRDHEGREEFCCVCKTVRFIDFIQRKNFQESCCISCEAPRLGQNVPGVNTFNTRPFILYLPNGETFSILIDIHNPNNPNSRAFVFRVEEVHDCCAILKALTVGGNPNNPTFTATNFCVTVDLCQFIGIQCLNDTFIPCV